MHVKGNLRRRDALKALGTLPFTVLVPLVGSPEPALIKMSRGRKNGVMSEATSAYKQSARVQLIPPSPVTDEIMLDIRGALENKSGSGREYLLSLYRDEESAKSLLETKTIRVPAYGTVGMRYCCPAKGWAGRHRVIFVASSPGGEVRAECDVEVLPSKYRSTETIGGAWVDIVHWSEAEGHYYNAALRQLAGEDWRQQIRGMHGIGMDIAVVQEVFLNNQYYGRNTIATKGYHGKAFYPSALFPGRAQIACPDPLEVILSEADRVHMSVFLGVGMYAWFDYSPPSLEWHKKVAAELWGRYGHHPSLYGWYVSEEVDGGIGDVVPRSHAKKGQDRYRGEIVDFFAGFQQFCRRLAPEKPVMLACNTFGMAKSRDVWPKILKHVDIICPFGFSRMPKGDLSSREVALLWRSMCAETGAHLWMDMETFVFQGRALVPRPIQGIVETLQDLRNFEKTICYEYSGIFNSPQSKVQPGGPETVKLYRDYLRYLHRVEAGAGNNR